MQRITGELAGLAERVLPLLYLRGLSSKDFVPALEGGFFGSKAGLSASVITRLTTGWQEEQRRFDAPTARRPASVDLWRR